MLQHATAINIFVHTFNN